MLTINLANHRHILASTEDIKTVYGIFVPDADATTQVYDGNLNTLINRELFSMVTLP